MMKNLKILLPMLAFIFAIGIAFAMDTKGEPDVQSDFIRLEDNTWLRISEQGCNGTAKNCQVQYGVGGPFYDVYDEMDVTTLKRAPANHQPSVINP